jgi:hypothetical protein
VTLAAADSERGIIGYVVYRIVEQEGTRWGYQVLRRAGFHPSVLGTRPYVSGAIIREDLTVRPFADVQRWFVTMADGDAEMVF